MKSLRQTSFWIGVAALIAATAIGTTDAQTRRGGGGMAPTFNSAAAPRSAPARPMMPTQTMAPRTPQFNSASRGPAMPSGSTTGQRLTKPLPLPASIKPSSSVAQMPSYTKRIAVTGAPIVVARTGKSYGIPQQGVFSSRIVVNYRLVKNKLGSVLVATRQQVIQILRPAFPTLTKSGRLDYSRDFESSLSNFRPGFQKFNGKLKEDLILVQYHDARYSLNKGRSAKWWTNITQANKLKTEDDVRQLLALPKSWPGERDAVSVARIPAGTSIMYARGVASAQKDAETGHVYVGGGEQYLFKEFDANWIVQTKVIPK